MEFICRVNLCTINPFNVVRIFSMVYLQAKQQFYFRVLIYKYIKHYN